MSNVSDLAIRASLLMLMIAVGFASGARVEAGQVVKSGSLSGAGAAMTQPLVLNAFDDQGGTLQLTSVHFEALTAMGGGYQTDGSGIVVLVDARLTADYSLGGAPLVSTFASLNLTVQNTGPPLGVSLFDSDNQDTTITDPSELSAWVGVGSVTLDVFTEFTITETPPGVIFFGAGGTVEYTVTYDFVPLPPSDTFQRGDTNGDGLFNIADPVSLLGELFSGDLPGACPDAADANDDGMLNIADAIYALGALFGGGTNPPAPFGACGVDPTSDPLDCSEYAPCP